MTPEEEAKMLSATAEALDEPSVIDIKTKRPVPKTRNWKPGESKVGRPKGSFSQRENPLKKYLHRNGMDVVKKCVELAKGGDVSAMRLCVERLLPLPRGRLVRLDIPRVRTAHDATEALAGVFNCATAGEISGAEASEYAQLGHALIQATTLQEILERLEKLESDRRGRA
jgi:hypothetical protein